MHLVLVNCIRNGDNGAFWSQKIALKKSMKFTFHCLFVIESHKIVQISTNLINFLSTTFSAQNFPLPPTSFLLTCIDFFRLFLLQNAEIADD